jgi:hypothetical protein
MTIRILTWESILVGLCLVVGLPLIGHYARQPGEPACALDGVKIDPLYQIEVIDRAGCSHSFCCPHCAELWLQRQPAPPKAVTVVDEMSGEKIAAQDAFFVRSFVLTSPATGNRIHCFRHRAEAEEHAATHAGTVLAGSERPFLDAR